MSELDTLVADDLYALTESLSAKGVDTDGGILGGEYGYGGEVDNDIFEMHQFWWGDCECGFEQLEAQWEDDVPHLEDCYQTELKRRNMGWKDYHALAAEWNLPTEYGSAVHCTCGQHEAWVAWRAANDHNPACPIVRPNFRHKQSGVEVRWYKYLGRGMEVQGLGSRQQWRSIISDCEAALS